MGDAETILAHAFHDLGFNVLPIGQDKRPRVGWDHWQTKRQTTTDVAALPFAATSTTGVGAVVGAVSGGLAVIDADKAGRHVLDSILGKLGLPRDYRWAVATPGGGYHVWIRSPRLAEQGLSSGAPFADFPGADHLELRWRDCQTVLPGSAHPSGGVYKWVHGNGTPVPTEPPAVVEPEKLMRLAAWKGTTEASKPAAAAPLPEVIYEGQGRDNTLASFAGTMRRRGASPESILAALRVENQRICSPPLPEHDLERIARSIGKKEPAARPDTSSIELVEPVQVFYAAPDLRDYVSPHIDWVIEKLLAKGVFTIFGGKPKAGKTTFLFGAVYAMQTGCPFMGVHTSKAKVLYITEQSKTTIRPKLAEYGLLDSPDVHIMFPRQMLGMAWEDIIARAATYCEDNSIDVVIVDTVNDLCHLENSFSDTEWLEALNPLQGLAQHGGLAVFASMHAKKEAASLVDMFRGSNAIVGKADIVLGLWRDGSGDETTRTVEGMSRLDNGFDERTRIVREGREYMTSGTVKEAELEAKLREYLEVLPTSRAAALTRQEIAASLDVTPGTVTTYITKLIATGKVLSETRPGTGNAKLYWAAGGAA